MPLLVPHSVVWAAAPQSSSRRPRMGLSYRGAQIGPWRMARTTVQWALLLLRPASMMNSTPGNGQGAGAVVRAKGRDPPDWKRRQVTTPVTSLPLICFLALPCQPAPARPPVGYLPHGLCGPNRSTEGSVVYSWAWRMSRGLEEKALRKQFEMARLCLGPSLALKGMQIYMP